MTRFNQRRWTKAQDRPPVHRPPYAGREWRDDYGWHVYHPPVRTSQLGWRCYLAVSWQPCRSCLRIIAVRRLANARRYCAACLVWHPMRFAV